MIPTGIVAAAVTPRREGPELDLAAAFELIDFLAARRPAGIHLLGPTGEYPHFTIEERARLVSLGVKRSRVPVIAGVSHSTFDGALALARQAAYAGAAALLLMPPPFYRYPQEDVREFLHNFADQFGQDTPVLIHNAPAFSSEVAAETLADLLASGLFAGVVDNSCSETPNAYGGCYLSGDDAQYVKARSAGCHGAVSPAACAVPELLVRLDAAVVAGDSAKIEQLEARLNEFLGQLRLLPEVFGIREALTVRGVKAGLPPTPPGARTLLRLSSFREWFQAWLPQVLKECS